MTATQSHHSHQDGLRSALSVAEELGLPLYRLHSWESLYPVFRTQQRDDGQSYYDSSSVEIVRHIARLLYQEGAKSHEIVSRLRQEGIIGTEGSGALPSFPKGDDVAVLTAKLTQLERENKQLVGQLEEFGQIALSLKTLEDENVALKQAQAAVQSAEAHLQKDDTYRQELEESNLALQATVERLKEELSRQKAQAQAQEDEQRAVVTALREELARLQTDYDTVREAEQKRQSTHEAETRAVTERQTHLESERQELVQKLEKSVLLMQALEDENVRLKRSLKEGEAMMQREQAELVERVQALESANTALKTECASLQKHVAAQDEQQYAAGQKQAGIQHFLQELRDELGQMKRLIAE